MKTTYVLQPILPYSLQENLQNSKAYISKPFGLSDIELGRVVKVPFSLAFQKFGPVTPNLQCIVSDDVIRNKSVSKSERKWDSIFYLFYFLKKFNLLWSERISKLILGNNWRLAKGSDLKHRVSQSS